MLPRRALPAGRLVTQNMPALLTGGTSFQHRAGGEISTGWDAGQQVIRPEPGFRGRKWLAAVVERRLH
jgi:hypothetical protein